MEKTRGDVEAIAVVGAGTMGSGIAQLCAQAGIRTVLVDTTEGLAKSGRERAAAFMAEGVRRGKLTVEERAAALDAIEPATDLAVVQRTDAVIEAVTEEIAIKREVLADVSELLADGVIATNTSAIPVGELASSVVRPERFAGMHFFNPPQLMKLVEIVPAVGTSDEATKALTGLADRLGKSWVVARDRPGFLVNSLLMPYLNQVIREFDGGLASAGDLDLAVERGLGYPVGPLKLLDRIGLDVHLHATEAAFEQTHDARFAPPPLLRRMVSAGLLGDKSGRGFHKGGSE